MLEDLFYSNPEELASLGAKVWMEHDVTEIDTVNKKIQVTDLQTGQTKEDTYDKLVMTTGSWPITPPIPGIEQDNIVLCKNYHQAQQLIAKAAV